MLFKSKKSEDEAKPAVKAGAKKKEPMVGCSTVRTLSDK